jgi:hypothetical protein
VASKLARIQQIAYVAQTGQQELLHEAEAIFKEMPNSPERETARSYMEMIAMATVNVAT